MTCLKQLPGAQVHRRMAESAPRLQSDGLAWKAERQLKTEGLIWSLLSI